MCSIQKVRTTLTDDNLDDEIFFRFFAIGDLDLDGLGFKERLGFILLALVLMVPSGFREIPGIPCQILT